MVFFIGLALSICNEQHFFGRSGYTETPIFFPEVTQAHTRGDGVGWGTGRDLDTGMVGSHDRTEQDAWVEPSGDRVGVSHDTRVEHMTEW